MITNIMNLSLMKMSMKESFQLNKEMMITTEVINILMMISLSYFALEYMIFKEMTKEEEKKNILMKITVILVAMAMMTTKHFSFMLMMEASMFPLILYTLKMSKNKDKKEALKFMMIMNMMGSIPFMAYTALPMKLMSKSYNMVSVSSKVMAMFSMILFLAKTPIFMMHFWLTKAHVSASGCCSMILASIMIKLGTVGYMKFVPWQTMMKLIDKMMSYSILTSVMLTMMMFRFFDLKTMIATSSILHMSMMTPMLTMKKSISLMPSIMMMSAHGLISCFLFYLAALKYEKSENRSMNFINAQESSMKLMAAMMFTFFFLNMGIPPFMNFISETMFLANLINMKSLTSMSMFWLMLMMATTFTMQMNSVALMKKNYIKKKKEITTNVLMNFWVFLMWMMFIMFFL